MYHNILVPVNGTAVSDSAIPHALKLAKDNDATVHALCTYTREEGYEGALSVGTAKRREGRLKERAETIVTEVKERADEEGVDCLPVVQSGDPTEVLLDYIDDEDIDVVVIGARKRSPTGKLLFGSMTQSLILHADVPVMVTG